MSERSKRQVEIVDSMIEEALQSARQSESDCVPLAAPEIIDEIPYFVGELRDWLETRDAGLLRALGISMETDGDGQLVFRAAHKARPFMVRPQTDRSIVVGGRIIHLDPEAPVLDQEVYDYIVERLLIWAGISETKPGKWLS